MLELRPYQIRAVADLRAAYARGRRAPCLVLPTGAGKTCVAAAIIQGALERGRRCLFLANRTELINQTVVKLAGAGITDVRVIQAQRDEGRVDAPVSVASVQTLTSERWTERLPSADLVIQDEVHHVVAVSFRRVIDAYPSARFLGLTATPCRADGRPLGDVCDEIVVGATVRELTELGHLARCSVLAPPDGAIDSGQIAVDPVAAYRQHGRGARAGVFCLTVKQATQYAEEFRSAGISADVITGATRNRATTLQRFAAGELRVLMSVGVLTEGWDDPGCAVAIIARKPAHVGLWLQICGRVLRPHPDKPEARIIDLCGAFWLHGPPDMEREYGLDGKAISSVARDTLRQCRNCGSGFLAGPQSCPYCAAELPIRPMPPLRVSGVGLSDVSAIKPKQEWIVRMLSKREGFCGRCARWFPAGTPILWSKGKRPQHQRCSLPALPSSTSAAA